MSNLVEVSGVKKGYGISKTVFENLNLALPEGKIIGLLGPNGSGKTTLIKMLVGLLQPEKGSIRICGHEVGPESKAVVSYLPERTYFNEYLKIRQLVNMFKDFYADFDERDKLRQKVPGLRNVALTAPYFHRGDVPTLDGAVKLMLRYQVGKELPQEDVDDIVAFLHSLNGVYTPYMQDKQ